MASLTQLLARHRRILVLDAASTEVTAGLLRAGEESLWAGREAEAGSGLFAATSEVLNRGGTDLADIEAFLYCAGPGSMLGLRTVAMTIRTWQALAARPAYAYASLALAARGAWVAAPRDFAVIADARRDAWHVQPISSDGSLGPLARLPRAALPSGELLLPDSFRTWSSLPDHVRRLRYDVRTFLADTAASDLHTESSAPDAFQPEAPAYQKWSARVHSADHASRSERGAPTARSP